MSRSTAALERRLQAALEPSEQSRQGRIGLEHEYTVSSGGEQLDFRGVIHRLGLPGRRLDPGDPNAYRLASGAVITADGREAEVVTPPALLAPGCTDRLSRWAHTATDALLRDLRHGGFGSSSLEGYSTHLSIEVPDGAVQRAAARFTRHFSAPMMLLMDREHSPGLIVRPRRGRLELCGEHVDGEQLRAAMVFATAATAASRSHRPGALPPGVRAAVKPSVHRYGSFIPRDAFGIDLYRSGRNSKLTTRSGGVVSAQDLLCRSWELTRRRVDGLFTVNELSLVDDIVDGRAPIPLEGPSGAGASGPVADTPHGSAIGSRLRRGVRISALVATWEFTVLEVSDATSTVLFNVPDRLLGVFLERLDSGALDGIVAEALAAPVGALPSLSDASQTGSIGVFGSMTNRSELLRDERDPVTGRLGGGGWRPGGRHQKDRRDEPERSRPRSRTLSPKVLAGVGAVVAIVAVAAVAVAAGGGGGDDNLNAGGVSPGGGLLPAPAQPLSNSGGGGGASAGPDFRTSTVTLSSARVEAVAECVNGAPVGRVELVVIPGKEFGAPQLEFGDPVPAGGTAVELTSVGSGHYEAVLPDGLFEVGRDGGQVRGDCTGSTTGLSGPSVIDHPNVDWDRKYPDTPGGPVIVTATVPDNMNTCVPDGRVGSVMLIWQTDSGSPTPGEPVGTWPLAPGADGTYRAEIPADQYLFDVGVSELAVYRCDFGGSGKITSLEPAIGVG